MWGTGTILLVEDEPMVRTVAERALARIEQAVRSRPQSSGGEDQELRARVREAIAELDQLIGSANG